MTQPNDADYVEAAEKVEALIEGGKSDIGNVRSYTTAVAEDIASKRQGREQATVTMHQTVRRIDACDLCDHNGHLWRSQSGDLLTADDPDAVTAHRCSHRSAPPAPSEATVPPAPEGAP